MCPYHNMSSVEPCQAGYYCPDGTLKPCPAGTYGNRSGLSTIDMCTDCPSGSYCEVKMFSAFTCKLIEQFSCGDVSCCRKVK